MKLALILLFLQSGFEAASIKPSPSYNGGPMYVGMKVDPGRVSYSNITIKYLIRTAYGVQTEALMDGGPSWIAVDKYDVQATLPEGSKPDQAPRMLQALLTERCMLSVHKENREQAVFALVPAKGGAKLKPHNPADPGNGNRGGAGHLELHDITVQQLANRFFGELGRQVVDATGLQGTFDVLLDWAPASAKEGDPAADRPSLQASLEQQLGLKLESRRAQVEYLVIDRVERPTEN